MKRVLLCGFLLSLAACQTATVGVHNVELPRDSAPRCGQLCAQIGLPLDSVVVMAENVGCVCRAVPPPTQTPGAPGASASAGGMAAIMIAQEAARQRQHQHHQQQQQRQQQQNSYKPKY